MEPNAGDRDNQLQKIHTLELKIAIEIKRICEKNNISYFLTGGTLLGAVRHGGFIPWDDDMDLGMLRDDYVRFTEACRTELGDEFFLQTWDTDADYPFSFAKIRLNDTRLVEEFSEKSGMHNGIFVDVFPFDNVPDNKIAAAIQAKKYFICKRLLWIKKGMGTNMKENTKQKIKYCIFSAFSHLFKYDAVKLYFKGVQTKYNGKRTEKMVTDGSYAYHKESIKRELADNLTYISFENEEFLTYKAKTEYLSHVYGDYMKLPPIDQRYGHKLLNVDFGPY